MASLVNARGVDSYPITSFTWIYLRAKPLDPARAAALDNLLSWGYSDGQTVAEKDGYTGLPPQLLTEVKRKLNELY
jgi:phosphate transport system substrate-binding protein